MARMPRLAPGSRPATTPARAVTAMAHRAQQLQREKPRPHGHAVFVLLSDSMQAHGRDIAPRSVVFRPLHQPGGIAFII